MTLYGKDITFVIILKIILLTLLWAMCFRSPPTISLPNQIIPHSAPAHAPAR